MTFKIFTYRTFAYFLAFLMLFSSIGFVVDLHLCCGKIKSYALFKKAKSCSEIDKDSSCGKMALGNCKDSKSTNICKKTCCENQNFTIQQDADFSNKVFSSLETQNFKTLSSSYIQTIAFKSKISHQAFYLNYKPPLIPANIRVLHQCFLI